MTDTLVPPPVDEVRLAREAAAGPSAGDYRRRLRRRLLLGSAPVVLVVLLLALKLLSLPVFAALAQWSYGDREFERSASLTEPLGVANVLEPWVHHFDRGTAYAQIGVLDVARDEFVTALEVAPDGDATISCVIRVNLVLTIEAQGDAALLDLRYADAEGLYAQGAKTIDEAPEGCFQPPESPQQPDTAQPLDDAEQRLDQKEQEARGGQGDEQQPGGDGSDPGAGGGEPGSGEGETESPDPLDQLQQQGDESQQRQQQDTDRDRYYEQNPGDYDGKPW